MTVEVPPGVLDGVETGSVVQRHVHSALAGGRAGVSASDGLAVSQSSTPGMSVRVASGYALVAGSTVTNQGLYGFHNDAAVDDLAISPGDPTNPRNDIVVAQVRDATYAGADDDCRLFVVEGTPGAVPADPTLPASCLALARVRVDANESTSILNADVTDLRVFAGDAPLYAIVGQYAIVLNTSMSIPTGVGSVTVVTFATEVADPGGWHSTSVNTDRVTPGVAGVYRVSVTARAVNNLGTTDRVLIAPLVNGTSPGTEQRLDVVAGQTNPILGYSTEVVLSAASDYIGVGILHGNGSARNFAVRMSVTKIA